MQRSIIALLAAAFLCVGSSPVSAQFDRGQSRVRSETDSTAQTEQAPPAAATVVSPQIAPNDENERALTQSLARFASDGEQAQPVFLSRSGEERSALATRLGARVSSRLTPFVLTPTQGYVPGRGEIDIALPSGFNPRTSNLYFREGRGSVSLFLYADANTRFIVDCDIDTAGAAFHLFMTDAAGTWKRSIDEPVVNGRLSVLLPATTSNLIGFMLRWPDNQPESPKGFWRFDGCEITPVEVP